MGEIKRILRETHPLRLLLDTIAVFSAMTAAVGLLFLLAMMTGAV